MTTDIS